MSMSIPTNTSTPSATTDALNFRENELGYSSPNVKSDGLVAKLDAQQTQSDNIIAINQEVIDETNEQTNAEKTQASQTLVQTGVSAIGVGAGVGALVGSIIPGIGTVIGGAVGALIGCIICLGCVIASLFVKPPEEPKDYMASAGQITGAVDKGAKSIETINENSGNQVTSTADATLVDSVEPAPTTTSTTAASPS